MHQIWRFQRWIALPVQGGRGNIVIPGDGFAHTRQMLHEWDAELLEVRRIPDARLHQQSRRLDCTQGDHHLKVGGDSPRLLLAISTPVTRFLRR